LEFGGQQPHAARLGSETGSERKNFILQRRRPPRTCRAKRLALVHIKRDIRRERFEEISKLARSVQEVEVIIPETGDRIVI